MTTKPTVKNKKRSRTAKSISLIDEKGVFSAYPKNLSGVPLEYQAAVYAKQLRERQASKPKRGWSPVLPGSYGSGKKR